MNDESTPVTIPATGMTCAAAQSLVQQTLEQQPGVDRASVNLLLNTATIDYHPGATDPQMLVEAVRETGYGAELPSQTDSLLEEQQQQGQEQLREYHVFRRKAAISVALGLIAMVLSMPLSSRIHQQHATTV